MLDRFVPRVGNSATTANANPISSLGNYTAPTVLVFRGISKYDCYRVTVANYEALCSSVTRETVKTGFNNAVVIT